MAKPLKLTDDEQPLYDELKHLVEELRSLYAAISPDETQIKAALSRASEIAHELHMKLTARKHEPRHHAYMYERRDCTPDSFEFYQHFHPCEDLVAFVENPSFARAPSPLSLDLEFEFPIYTRRWGHYDRYRLKRTEAGWQVLGTMQVGREPADKRGRPSLFDIFRHDNICYPAAVGAMLERIWFMASGHATAKEVRRAVKALAEWISTCERSAPKLADQIATESLDDNIGQ